MVVAVVALIASLSGSAYAALVITGKSIKNGTVTTKDIRNHSLSGTDMRRDGIGGGSIKESTLGTVPGAFLTLGAARFAVVNANGQAVRGRDISASAPPSHSEISVSSLGSNVNGVAIRTQNGGNGNQLNRSFHLIVMC
jgi:hypothetical protein